MSKCFDSENEGRGNSIGVSDVRWDLVGSEIRDFPLLFDPFTVVGFIYMDAMGS